MSLTTLTSRNCMRSRTVTLSRRAVQRTPILDKNDRAAIIEALGFKSASELHCVDSLSHVSTELVDIVLNDVSRGQYLCRVPKQPIRYMPSLESVLEDNKYRYRDPFTTLVFGYHLEEDGVHLDSLQATEVLTLFALLGGGSAPAEW